MTQLSNLERTFILRAIEESQRLDGRQPYDYRRLKIEFGQERGCCMVHMGDTSVLAQVSCEVIEPKGSRPSEGQLFVNLELSPMASPSFEAGRLSDAGIELNRLLERTLKESRAVDLESLCIVAGERVWQIRVDVHALNHDGNLLDGASIAGIAALSHFRRPDVSVIGENVTIHTPQERDPVPLNVHHMPVCVTFAFYNEGKHLLVDPTEKEEGVMEGTMVVGMNIHQELCTMQVTGSMLLLKEQILRCCQVAVVKVDELTELIKQALENDTRARKEGKKFGFAELPQRTNIFNRFVPGESLDTSRVKEEVAEIMDAAEPAEEVPSKPEIKAPGLGQIGDGLTNSWMEADEEEDDEEEDEDGDDDDDEMEGEAASDDDDEEEEDVAMTNSHKKTTVKVRTRDSDEDSEEEETVTLAGTDLESITNRTKHQKISGNGDLDLSVAVKKSGKDISSRDGKEKGGKKKWKKGQNVKGRP